MEDMSFLNLLTDDNLKNITIDPRLTDSFKRVMNKIQIYFNDNGYTSERNYQEFFNKYLLNPEKGKNLSFHLNKEPQEIKAGGFYDGQRICVDENLINNPEKLDMCLCHEFIHFLVMKDIKNNVNANPVIKNGGFINEGLTQLLTLKINPEWYLTGSAYEPQVQMVKFANLLSGVDNDFSLFMRGNIDSIKPGGSWNEFIDNAEKYHDTLYGKKYSLVTASTNNFYIAAQRNLIDAHIVRDTSKYASFEEYTKTLYKLLQRPVSDNKYMEELFSRLESFLISKFNVNDSKIQELLTQQIKEFRQIATDLIKYNYENVYEFYVKGHKIAIDEKRNIYGAEIFGSYSIQSLSNGNILELHLGSEVVKINLNIIDFKKWKKDILEKQRKLAKFFSTISKEDIKMVSHVAQTEELLKLESFSLPAVGTEKQNKKNVYIATYNDRIEVLNEANQIGTINNVALVQYLGKEPETGVITTKSLGNIETAHVYSTLTPEQLRTKIISTYAKQISTSLTLTQISQIIEQYKKSDAFDPEDTLKPQQLKDFAIWHYAENQYEKTSNEEKQKIYDMVVNSQEKFIVSTDNGKVTVSLLYDKNMKQSFRATSEVLIDKKGDGLYNEIFKTIEGNKTSTNPLKTTKIKTGTEDKTQTSQKNVNTDFTEKTLPDKYSGINPEILNIVNMKKEECRQRNGYNSMTEDEKREFDEKLDKATAEYLENYLLEYQNSQIEQFNQEAERQRQSMDRMKRYEMQQERNNDNPDFIDYGERPRGRR